MAGLTVAGFGVSCLPVDYFYSLVQQKKLIVAQTTKPTPRSQSCSMYLKNMYSALYQEIAELAREGCNFAVPYGPELKTFSVLDIGQEIECPILGRVGEEVIGCGCSDG